MVYVPNSRWTWSFLGISLVQAAVALGLESYVFVRFRSDLKGAARYDGQTTSPLPRTIPTYLGLLIFAFIYQLILVYDGLAAKNTIQIIGLVAMNMAILVYTAIQFDQILEAADGLLKLNYIEPGFWLSVMPYLIAVPAIIGIGTICLTFVAWKLYGEFAWTIYKTISADLRMKRRFLIYQIYIALLKFDFFLFLGFEVQFLIIVKETSDAEFYITIAMVPITVVLLLFAAWSTKRENTIGMLVSILVYMCATAYFIFKLVRMYTVKGSRLAQYKVARPSLTVFAVITLVLMLVTLTMATWCTLNFNKGLKPHINKRSNKGAEDGVHGKWALDDVPSKGGHAGANSSYAGGSRMEID
ncbi:hypothetical protein FKW77_010203 [Venturia effusa]|uniref:Uncharacterized protein n=1 Tax=Venturia effusa TaxID=50376 RepID=A0A517L6C1_9PEZI|nr:hypothetical protein FKW77_010203 [Venturia effusa]